MFQPTANERRTFNLDTPLVSIAIPAYNEEHNIAACLRSIALQRTAAQVEVVVCLNACTDQTARVVSQTAKQENLDAKVVDEPVKGIACARQRAFQEARGDIILSADADSEYPPTWVEQIITNFRLNPEAALVYGPVYFKGLRGLAGKIMPYLYPAIDILITMFDQAIRRPNVRGPNFAVTRRSFLQVGGFSVDLTAFEDNDLARRLLQQRGRQCIRYDPRLVVYSSARRYNHYGLWRGILYYLIGYFQTFVLQNKTLKFQDVRALDSRQKSTRKKQKSVFQATRS